MDDFVSDSVTDTGPMEEEPNEMSDVDYHGWTFLPEPNLLLQIFRRLSARDILSAGL